MSTGRLTGQNQLREAYRRVLDRVAQALHAAGRRPADVLVVAVTTGASPDQIRTLVDMGHVDLGETQVQQLNQRVAQLEEFLHRRRQLAGAAPRLTPVVTVGPVPGEPNQNPAVRWHMLGPLERAKVRSVVPLVRLIHSVDSLRLAEELHTFIGRQNSRSDPTCLSTVEILLQINATGDNLHGVIAPAVRHVCEQIETMVHVRLRGLMSQSLPGCNPQQAEMIFGRAADIFADVQQAKIGGREFNILSMGNSDNFEMAIRHGANIVRIGKALFTDAAYHQVAE